MIGFTPQQVNDMSLWEYMAAVDGYVDAHSQNDGSLTQSEADELWSFIQCG